VLAVDWVPSRPERPEGLIVVYDGGVLSEAEIEEIVLADGDSLSSRSSRRTTSRDWRPRCSRGGWRRAWTR
jgi:hypothetical protein